MTAEKPQISRVSSVSTNSTTTVFNRPVKLNSSVLYALPASPVLAKELFIIKLLLLKLVGPSEKYLNVTNQKGGRAKKGK